MMTTFRQRAVLYSGLGALLIFGVLAHGLRSVPQAVRLMLPVLLAIALTAGTLVAAGSPLTVLHLVALLLVLGVGINYALFIARAVAEHDDAGRTLRTLAVVSGTTLCAFGMLAWSRMAVLQVIGSTVCIGVAFSLSAARFSSVRGTRPDRRGTQMHPLPIAASTMTNACGVGTLEVQRALQAGTSGLRQNDFEPAAKLATWIGRVDAVDESRIPRAYAAYDCRNNRLAQVALEQDGFLAAVRRAAQHYGANRVGVFLGTTTSGILATELAYRAIVRRRQAPTPRCPRTSTDAVIVCSRRRSSCARISVSTAPRRRFPQPVRRAPRCSRWLPGPSPPVIATPPLSAAWIRSRCPRCSASSRWNCCRAIPASHAPSIATEFRSVKRRALRFSIQVLRPRCASPAPAKAATPITCPVRILTAPVRQQPCVRHWQMRILRRITSTTFTCMARRAGRTTPPKTARCLGVRRWHASEFDQGMDRPHAGQRESWAR